jgi:hypothetical protein
MSVKGCGAKIQDMDLVQPSIGHGDKNRNPTPRRSIWMGSLIPDLGWAAKAG